MFVAGLWGGIDLRGWVGHDACAALLHDGRCVAAIEEERLTRVKHTRAAPQEALAFCLRQAGIDADTIDCFAIGISERAAAHRAAATMIGTIARCAVPDHKLAFVDHHVAHAYGAHAESGLDRSLVLTLDGRGDEYAGLVAVVRDAEVEKLRSIPIADSLGHLYLLVTNFLGYRLFDEYKVMGLAPYGDPARFRHVLQGLYELRAEGNYRLALDRPDLLWTTGPRRRSGEPFTQVHKDLAASLQEALETIVFHVCRHFRATTGVRDLCLAGGVAHNCSLNGKLAAAGMFDRMFVPPAAHDAGTAIGAAALVHRRRQPGRRLVPRADVYLGSPLPPANDVAAAVRQWSPLLRRRRSLDVVRDTAALLAGRAVVGWVQGRSEFGPRALGNRSILADPRPAANKDRINAMVKKREAYRPFAPAVLAERAHDFFDLPPTACNLDAMVFVVPVRPDKRALLGAVTHVDGSARLQTVSRTTNEPFWRLIEQFGRETGVPILLNTSFNNAWEPIVDSVADAIACFITTDLDVLIVGDEVIEKQPLAPSAMLAFGVRMSPHVELAPAAAGAAPACLYENAAYIRPDRIRTTSFSISPSMFEILRQADGTRTLGELGQSVAAEDELAIATELLRLWERRLVVVAPLERPQRETEVQPWTSLPAASSPRRSA